MNKTWLRCITSKIKWNIQSLSSEINLIRLSKWDMFMLVFKRLMTKNSSTSSSASPMKHLEFNRSPKQALSVRDVNKPRTSRSTLSICGTSYFSGSCSPIAGVPPQWKKNNRSSTLSIFQGQRTPFSCFPFVFLLSPGFWYVGFGTNRIGSLVFFYVVSRWANWSSLN